MTIGQVGGRPNQGGDGRPWPARAVGALALFQRRKLPSYTGGSEQFAVIASALLLVHILIPTAVVVPIVRQLLRQPNAEAGS